MSMDLAVMEPANGHGELVADLSPERTGLGKAQVMWVGRRAAAHEACLSQNESSMLLIAQTNRLT